MASARDIIGHDDRFRLDLTDVARVRQGLVGAGVEVEYVDGRWVLVKCSELKDGWIDRFAD